MREHSSTLPRAAVITADRRVHLPGRLADTAVDPHDLTTILAARMADHSTVICEGARPTAHEAQARQLTGRGWAYGQIGPWTLWRHDRTGRTVAVGCRDSFRPHHYGALIEPTDDPGVLATLLHRYATLTGVAWRGTAATTGLAKMRLTWENAREQPRWVQPKTGPGYASGPIIWSRPLTERERSWGWVHTFDASAAYLGSAGNAELAWSTLRHGQRPFDRHVPGYWLVSVPPQLQTMPDGCPPLIPPARLRRDGTVWLTTPMAGLVASLADEKLEVCDAWTAAEHNGRSRGRVLRDWAAQLRDARMQARDGLWPVRLERAVKRTYKDATGGLQREGMRVYRPDWAHTLIDLWRATLFRRILAVHRSQGVWPVAVKTDSVSYADCVPWPQPRHSLVAGYGEVGVTLTDALDVAECGHPECGCARRARGGLGTYRHEATVTTDEWIDAHEVTR